MKNTRFTFGIDCGSTECRNRKNRMGNASLAPKRRVPHAPTAIGGIADGVRRSTADTLERG